MQRRTKIITTLGPATSGLSQMVSLIKAGCDVVRLNVAHGDLETHRRLIDTFKKAAQRVSKTVGIMLDIKGPEIRAGEIDGGEVVLKTGQTFILTPHQVIGTSQRVSINFDLAPYLQPGDFILLDDGRIKLKVIEIEPPEVITRVVSGGRLKSHKGVNIPGRHIPMPYLTSKDKQFLELAVEQKVDFIAASFVRSAEDIYVLKNYLFEKGVLIPVIAKIETASAVKNIDDILLISEGIMVARGDLGVEMPLEKLPGIQKYLLKKALEHAKPAIIATQILESMITNPTPTRAEVADIAGSILDGADALMLSGETAVGQYPIEAVKVLSKVAKEAEKLWLKRQVFVELKGGISHNTSNAAVLLANEIKANAIVCITRSGKTARLVAKHRPSMPVIVASYQSEVLRQSCLLWGTQGFVIEKEDSTDVVIKRALQRALALGLVKKTDVLVVTAGEPKGIAGTTNILRVQVVGDILGRGVAFGNKCVYGRVTKYPSDIQPTACEILISRHQPPTELIFNSKGVVIETDVVNPKVIEEAVKKAIVVVIGVRRIYEQVKDGEFIYVDASRGIIWR